MTSETRTAATGGVRPVPGTKPSGTDLRLLDRLYIMRLEYTADTVAYMTLAQAISLLNAAHVALERLETQEPEDREPGFLPGSVADKTLQRLREEL